MKSSPKTAAHWRFIAGVLVVCALFAVQLYIYSPWHQHPQGRQFCNFNPVEQSNGLQPSSQAMLITPVLACCGVADRLTPLAAGWHFEQLPSRAPPA